MLASGQAACRLCGMLPGPFYISLKIGEVGKMKLKTKPDDFLVEEFLPLALADSGDYAIYRLEKSEMDTLSALGHVAKRAGVKLDQIGYSGVKDKHAKTIQYISIPSSNKQFFIAEPRLRVSLLGYSNKPIQLGEHKTNKFTITVRQILLGRVEAMEKRAGFAFSHPIPNYYDSQRFGSFIDGESVGVFAVKGDYENALRVYLTGVRKSDLAHIKADKRAILAVWPKISEAEVHDRVLSDICKTYALNKDWKAAYERIPAFEREIQEQAVASFVWNESLKLLLKEVKTEKTFSVLYAAGSLLFGQPEAELPKTLESRKDIVESVYKKFELPHSQRFDWNRNLMFTPINGKLVKVEADDLSKRPDQMRKIVFSFELPPGSYATVVLKAILRA